MEKWLTVSDIAKETNVPDSTCRRYISKFNEFFVSKGGGRGKKYDSSSVKVIMRIQSLYADGYETDDIDRILRTEFGVVVNDDDETISIASTLATVEDIQDIQVVIASEVQRALEQQKQEFITLLKQQQEYIDNRLLQRDQQLMTTIREIQEQKRFALESVDYKKDFDTEFENMNKQLQEIQKQQNELKDIQEDESQFKELVEQIESLTQQLHEMKQAMQESAASKEERVKKPFWKFW
jgi:uncharacterized phage infection (PIP) family protein YhgE